MPSLTEADREKITQTPMDWFFKFRRADRLMIDETRKHYRAYLDGVSAFDAVRCGAGQTFLFFSAHPTRDLRELCRGRHTPAEMDKRVDELKAR